MRKKIIITPKHLGLLFAVTVVCLLYPLCLWAAPADSDGDGIGDNKDLCPNTESFYFVNAEGCPYDSDGDGIYAGEIGTEADCNDSDKLINPDAEEVCGDGVDQNCDGADLACSGGGDDTDADGLTDTLESGDGVVLSKDLTLLSRDGTLPGTASCDASGCYPAVCDPAAVENCHFYLPPCDSDMLPNDPVRALCVDSGSQDFFVITQRATGCSADDCAPLFDNDGDGIKESNIPLASRFYGTTNPGYFDPFATITTAQGSLNEGGLGIAVHELLQDTTVSTNQLIADNAYAVRFVENLATNSGYFGLSTPGVPGPNSVVTVWTERIKKWIFNACTYTSLGPVGECHDMVKGVEILDIPYDSLIAQGYGPQTNDDLFWPIYQNFIQDIVSHELGHTVNLAVGVQVHFPAGEGVVMEQSIAVDATKKRNDAYAKTMLYISNGYHYDSKQTYELQ
jgi:hypothetical protein